MKWPSRTVASAKNCGRRELSEERMKWRGLMEKRLKNEVAFFFFFTLFKASTFSFFSRSFSFIHSAFLTPSSTIQLRSLFFSLSSSIAPDPSLFQAHRDRSRLFAVSRVT
ncbi:hypothetical protein RIF29_05188 [Crotalaria pallida]|uniref:Uncharacterized protein n=1 Tax=Crotalaria pallida TaxID=3830 RepID=A0AAN9P9M8_CROPI